MPAKSHGFTLIELMIVAVIIGILGFIAYPSYVQWVVETRRSDAHVALSQMANELQKFYSECGIYTDKITGTRKCDPAALGADALSPGEHYDLKITLTGTGYTITATPRGSQAVQDQDCTTLTLAHTGATGATGADTTRCWRK